uniref:Gag-like protein n=1 Tax=Mycena chlorophos TaxID=658473 RepID=A0ABQ0L945_MYCCL|nr:predicted protein [Mycena chlorophos]
MAEDDASHASHAADDSHDRQEEQPGPELSDNITVRRSNRRRVAPIPADAHIITPPRPTSPDVDPPSSPPSPGPYRPTAQLRVLSQRDGKNNSNPNDDITGNVLAVPPEVTSAPRTRQTRDDGGKRGGARPAPMASGGLPPSADRQDTHLPALANTSDQAHEHKPHSSNTSDTAKKAKFSELHQRVAEVDSLEALTETLREAVKIMKLHKKSAPTKACFDVLDAITERFSNHHEFPSADENPASFSRIVTRSVVDPVRSLTAQVENQVRAIQCLTKTVENIKNAPVASACGPVDPLKNSSYASVAAKAKPTGNSSSKPKSPPLPNPSNERILLRFDGALPPLINAPYKEILDKLNAHLLPLGLPRIEYTQKRAKPNESPGLFIVPSNGERGVAELTARVDEWATGILLGARIVPAAGHSFMQVDGIPFASAPSLEDIRKEFEERNPALGPVVSTPRWVNTPPSEAKVAALAAAGRKPPTAGSVVFQLQSRDTVDRAVAEGRVILCGHAPSVSRCFPHLRLTQCWGCFKFGHTRARCGKSNPSCAGCGKENHGVICAEKPSCINCGGAHRADSYVCPVRKRVAEDLRARAAELSRQLDEQSRFYPANSPTASPLGSPRPSCCSSHSLPLAPRVPERA